MRPENGMIASIREASREGKIPTWNGDNRDFVLNNLMRHLVLRPHVIQVLKWAYGTEGMPLSFEKLSNGKSVLPDWVCGNNLKDPPAVGHDMLFICHDLRVPMPDGDRWGFWRSNEWYEDALEDFGYPRIARFEGALLDIFSYPTWAWPSKQYRKYWKYPVVSRLSRLAHDTRTAISEEGVICQT